MVRFLFAPTGAKFFDLFEKSAQNLVLASRMLVDLFDHYEDVSAKVQRLTDYEQENDNVTHQVMEQLHRTFVTPLDREDISLLIHSLDDVMDFIEDVATSLQIYRIAKPTDRARELAAIIPQIAEELNQAIPLLRQRTRLKHILKHCVEINRLENEADSLLRQALVELFDNSSDLIEIVKWREIYQLLESATDRGEDVANVLEGMVLKHA